MTEQQLTLDLQLGPDPESLDDDLAPIDIALWSRIEAMSRAEIEIHEASARWLRVPKPLLVGH